MSMHTEQQIKTKIDGLREYLKMHEGMILDKNKIDSCNQFLVELEADFKKSKNSS